MAKIQICGAGGAPSNSFIRSMRDAKQDHYLIGTNCIPSDLLLAQTDEKHIVPAAEASNYNRHILKLLAETRPDFLHAQNDFEVRAISRMREEIEEAGVKLYLPSKDTIENCINKERSAAIWEKKGIRIPKTILLRSPEDLKKAFNTLGNTIWVRAIEGGGGRGALPTDDFDFARAWIDRYSGWGEFTASELLSANTVTWMSIWHHGELVVAQTRKRHMWQFGNRTLSGVTGVTGVGETISDLEVDKMALDAIAAIDNNPHGIFSVDMTYDFSGVPNPTEINIGRFFTTHYFFTKAGLNFPEILCDIAINNQFPSLEKKINPLPDGLIWVRGMDIDPMLSTIDELKILEAAAKAAE